MSMIDHQDSSQTLQFNFNIITSPSPQLALVEFTVTEGLSQPFCIQLKCASRHAQLNIHDLLDQRAYLSIIRNGQYERFFHGIITTIRKSDTGAWHTIYEIELEPSIKRLALRHNSRIFQHKTVKDIVEIILKENHIFFYNFVLRHNHHKREYCVQYRETDIEFIQRILAEEGIFYYFSHSPQQHTLFLTDDCTTLTTLPTTCIYNNQAGGLFATPHIWHFCTQASLAHTVAVLDDYCFKQPSASLQQAQQGQKLTSIYPYEYFDYPGRYKNQDVGYTFTKTRIAALQRNANTAKGHSNIPDLMTGYYAQISDHPDHTAEKKWLFTEITHEGKQPQALENEGYEGLTSYYNNFLAVPDHLQWKPPQNPRPRVDGPQVATVAGPDSEVTHCDEYGRVMVQFPWDREGQFNQHSSCWIRVAQHFAGNHYGWISIPRIGHEVIVNFLEGDPDQPIIMGSTFNAKNAVPNPLPIQKTKTILRTQTHRDTGFNELSFDDEHQNELVYLHAQKNLQRLIQHDEIVNIKNDLHEKITHNHFYDVLNESHQRVKGDRKTQIKSDDHYTVEGTLHQHHKTKWLSKTEDELHFKVGNKITLSAGTEINLQVGVNFIKIDHLGIHINGNLVSYAKTKMHKATPALPKLPHQAQSLKDSVIENNTVLSYLFSD